MSVSRAKCEVSATEFIRWRAFIKKARYEVPDTKCHYLASLAYHVHMLTHVVAHLFDPKPPAFTLTHEDFLLKFTSAAPAPEVSPEEEEELYEAAKSKATENSKMFWGGLLALAHDPRNPMKEAANGRP